MIDDAQGNTLWTGGNTIYPTDLFVWSQWLFRGPARALAVLCIGIAAVCRLSILFMEELLEFPAFHRRL